MRPQIQPSRTPRPIEPPESEQEAVGLFHDRAAFSDAVDDLLNSGFDQSEISVLAKEGTVRQHLGHDYSSTSELEDDFAAPRTTYVPPETVGNAKGGIIAAMVYVPAMIGTLIVAASGGSVLAIVAVAVVSGGLGGSFGSWLAARVGREHADRFAEHLERGGLLLWVRTRDEKHQALAVAILRRHSGADVHIHTLPARREPTFAERYKPYKEPEQRVWY